MQNIDIISLIDKSIMENASSQNKRDYMGASGLGEPCDRKLWYSYKQPKSVDDPRIHRIFHLGHNLEDVMVKYMRDAGLVLHTHDEDGNQFGFEDGIIAGHIDGVIELPTGPMLVEFKTFNTKRFEEFRKKGVQQSDPKYFTQVQVYMGKMDLDQCMFIGIDKNDCEIHIEYIHHDPFEENWAVNRGKEIGNRDTEPDRKYGHKSHFSCKQCSWKSDCWKDDSGGITNDKA